MLFCGVLVYFMYYCFCINVLLLLQVGMLSHWRLGNVRWDMVPRLSAFSAVGGVLGGMLAVHAAEEFLIGAFMPHACAGGATIKKIY